MSTSKFPPGILDGQHIRLHGQGMPGQNGAGDLMITVSIAPHPVFKLEGLDVRLDLPITVYEAALGAKVRVPTLDKPVEIAIPPWTSSGRTFRLKGKGFPAKAGRGDLLATVRIVLPENGDPEFEELMKKWQSDKPYDPRKSDIDLVLARPPDGVGLPPIDLLVGGLRDFAQFVAFAPDRRAHKRGRRRPNNRRAFCSPVL